MSDRIMLTRALSREASKPGTWFLTPVGLIEGKLFGSRDASMLNIVCPECGKSATLRNPLYDSDGSDWPLRADGTRGHDVAADGTVSPSVVCPHKPCTWHVFARLSDWSAP